MRRKRLWSSSLCWRSGEMVRGHIKLLPLSSVLYQINGGGHLLVRRLSTILRLCEPITIKADICSRNLLSELVLLLRPQGHDEAITESQNEDSSRKPTNSVLVTSCIQEANAICPARDYYKGPRSILLARPCNSNDNDNRLTRIYRSRRTADSRSDSTRSGY